MKAARAIIGLAGLLAGAAWAQLPAPGLSADLRLLQAMLVLPDLDLPAAGSAWEAHLTLKQATPRMLVFADAFLVNASGLTYPIAKWEVDPALAEPLHGLRHVPCRVSFVVQEVRKSDACRTMPHVVARITGLEPLHPSPPGNDGAAP